MTVFPHCWRPQFGTPGFYDPEKTSFAKPRPSVISVERANAAKKFMAFRQAALAADQSVDTFMRRGEARTRFHYFGEGETP